MYKLSQRFEMDAYVVTEDDSGDSDNSDIDEDKRSQIWLKRCLVAQSFTGIIEDLSHCQLSF